MMYGSGTVYWMLGKVWVQEVDLEHDTFAAKDRVTLSCNIRSGHDPEESCVDLRTRSIKEVSLP